MVQANCALRWVSIESWMARIYWAIEFGSKNTRASLPLASLKARGSASTTRSSGSISRGASGSKAILTLAAGNFPAKAQRQLSFLCALCLLCAFARNVPTCRARSAGQTSSAALRSSSSSPAVLSEIPSFHLLSSATIKTVDRCARRLQ